jgi:hypothetical protein
MNQTLGPAAPGQSFYSDLQRLAVSEPKLLSFTSRAVHSSGPRGALPFEPSFQISAQSVI